MGSSGSSTIGTIVYLIILVAFIAGLWKIFEKAGKPGWAAIVPIYNLIVLLQIVGKPLWWIILFIIPIVNLIAMILVMMELVKRFGQPGWHVLLAIFFGFVYIPYLGFSELQYKA
jgi:hypothetical protein